MEEGREGRRKAHFLRGGVPRGGGGREEREEKSGLNGASLFLLSNTPLSLSSTHRMPGEREREREGCIGSHCWGDGGEIRRGVPTNNALLINFRPSSDAEILPDKHRPGMQVGARTCKRRVCDLYIFQLSCRFAHPTVGGWDGVGWGGRWGHALCVCGFGGEGGGGGNRG